MGILWIIALICFAAAFWLWQNNCIVITHIDYSNKKIPEAFDGTVILHISDLHNKRFGKDQETLLRHTQEICPELIVITGDFIDGYTRNPAAALCFAWRAAEIAPVYFVSGNNEYQNKKCTAFYHQLEATGVRILHDKRTKYERNGDAVHLIGVKDPAFSSDEAFAETLKKLSSKTGFQILLTHRPEKLPLYQQADIDLVFAGHAHGGQIRLPGIGGLYAPDQGVFPKYTAGMHTMGDTSMIVSRGLGNSLFPLRVFNRPELVLIRLRRGAK